MNGIQETAQLLLMISLKMTIHLQNVIRVKPTKKMEPRKEKEFFVKWKHMSYWHCEWLSETFMEVYFMPVSQTAKIRAVNV
jgi:hypothetical protein